MKKITIEEYQKINFNAEPLLGQFGSRIMSETVNEETQMATFKDMVLQGSQEEVLSGVLKFLNSHDLYIKIGDND